MYHYRYTAELFFNWYTITNVLLNFDDSYKHTLIIAQ